MPNAWFYYLLPLLVGIVFVAVGLRLFRLALRGHRDSKGRKYGSGEACFGILFMLVGAGVALGVLLTSPTPWARQRLFHHIFHTPAERIRQFVIEPRQPSAYRQLTMLKVVIDDPGRIRQIACALHAAQEVSPNHPNAQWTAGIEMVTADGTYYFGVEATVPGDPNGTLVNVSSNPYGGGWNLGDARADGLQKILEGAVAAAAAR